MYYTWMWWDIWHPRKVMRYLKHRLFEKRVIFQKNIDFGFHMSFQGCNYWWIFMNYPWCKLQVSPSHFWSFSQWQLLGVYITPYFFSYATSKKEVCIWNHWQYRTHLFFWIKSEFVNSAACSFTLLRFARKSFGKRCWHVFKRRWFVWQDG